MSRRGRIAVFAIAAVALAGTAALVALTRADPGSVAAGSRGDSGAGTTLGRTAGLAHRIERWGRERAQEAAAAIDPSEVTHRGPRAADRRRLERIEAGAERVARRFFVAFAAYERGLFDRRLAAKLRATSTAAWGRILLATPPRVTVANSPPAPAHLGALEFVATDSDLRRREVVRGELVGDLVRAGRREPIAIRMQLAPHRWRVAGIGR